MTALLAPTASAQDLPIDGHFTLRPAATPVAEMVHDFHNHIMVPVMVGISLLVLALLIWVVIRYNKKANPVAQRFSHNTTIEVIWTLAPVAILIVIALGSFPLLFNQDRIPDAQVHVYEGGTGNTQFIVPNDFADSRKIKGNRHLEVELVDGQGNARTLSADGDYTVEGFGEEELVIALASPVPNDAVLRVTGGRSRIGVESKLFGLLGDDRTTLVPAPTVTVKAVGFQWGWSYSYPDFGNFEFDALIAPQDSVAPELYRLATTNDVVVPAGETIRVVTTGRDVIHSWAMPNFAIKIDAIPGRLNETWFYTEQEGTYYGQCSEICGIDHAFMPISVRVVPRPEFEAWVNEQMELNGLEPVFADAAAPAEQKLANAADAAAAR